ncbi:hypothetical protein DEU56DRAFT_761041 [Suillus clintonianus]|uniref:uncharacterized protein n=1 Tax=Suillus clintonianus TaxID=1904413 RepID=UPI001B869B85|nr:uncharacterized protein DEU56DRAFT_761041 [Suillus clintonianus]KAG2119338.1 hypothetical protein DEU56DRAFT_761041 [Suillus clintonianus]
MSREIVVWGQRAQGSADSIDRAAADRAATEYRKLIRHWEAGVAEILNLQGFSRFLLPPPYTELQAAARHGPVIILITSQYSCSAIVVPTSGEPHHVRFPRITLADLEKLKDDFATAIRHTAHTRLDMPRMKLRVLLRIIWDEIMLPVVKVLQHDLKLRPQGSNMAVSDGSLRVHPSTPSELMQITLGGSHADRIFISALIRPFLRVLTAEHRKELPGA